MLGMHRGSDVTSGRSWARTTNTRISPRKSSSPFSGNRYRARPGVRGRVGRSGHGEPAPVGDATATPAPTDLLPVVRGTSAPFGPDERRGQRDRFPGDARDGKATLADRILLTAHWFTPGTAETVATDSGRSVFTMRRRLSRARARFEKSRVGTQRSPSAWIGAAGIAVTRRLAIDAPHRL